MRSFVLRLLIFLGSLLPVSCVDQLDLTLRGTVNVVVVDGTITNLAEPQLIRLNLSKADSLTGRFGTLPLTKAQVEVVVDSAQVVACHEAEPGTYVLPGDFRGQVGHAYQLRFTLSDGSRYQSTQQIMQPVPPIDRVTARFNPKAITPPFASNIYTAGHDFFLDARDPVDAHNYYRWEWKLYEPQQWCRSCYESFYAVNELVPIVPFEYPTYYTSTQQPFEDCFYPALGTAPHVVLLDHRFDYSCRTQCWEIIYSHSINVFSDQLTNGGLIVTKPVAHIPFYQYSPCLVDIRQESLTKDAFGYFDLFQQQTQNTGGVADTPPTALGGNIHNAARQGEVIVGYFTASAVAVVPYYLDRKDTGDVRAPGLFFALNGREPIQEMRLDIGFILNAPARPPTAVCGPIDQRTSIKPDGWRD